MEINPYLVTIKDLQDCETATRSFGSPRSRGTATETIHFNFGRMSVLVAFTNESGKVFKRK